MQPRVEEKEWHIWHIWREGIWNGTNVEWRCDGVVRKGSAHCNARVVVAWQRHGNGMAVAWQWHGNGMAMAWQGHDMHCNSLALLSTATLHYTRPPNRSYPLTSAIATRHTAMNTL